MEKVAVTGGVASGKTTVCQFFKELGAYVVSSDVIVHQLLSPDTNTGKKVIELLGQAIVKDGKLDRQKIAEIVFHNRELLDALEKLLHPLVMEEIDKEYKRAKEQKASLFVAEVPLLYEGGFETHFDVVVAVVADKPWVAVQKEREERQWPQEKKAEFADYVIRNSGSLQALKQLVAKLYNQLIAEEGK